MWDGGQTQPLDRSGLGKALGIRSKRGGRVQMWGSTPRQPSAVLNEPSQNPPAPPENKGNFSLATKLIGPSGK